MENENPREKFIKRFFGYIILSLVDKKIKEKENLLKRRRDQDIIKKAQDETLKQIRTKAVIPQVSTKNSQQPEYQKKFIQKPSTNQRIVQRSSIIQRPQISQVRPNQNYEKTLKELESKTPSKSETIDLESLNKIKALINDPNVLSVECLGPDKEIRVNSGGMIKQTPIKLTKQEIDTIIKDISQKTMIPLTPGVFKAVLGRFLITAVISDFVGTRFVITKRNPFMKY